MTSPTETIKIANEVTLELKAMKEIGMRIPAKAFKYVEANKEEMAEFRNSGMKIAEIADYVIGASRIL
jgi:imidazolonepropionase-like amidohydrolase